MTAIGPAGAPDHVYRSVAPARLARWGYAETLDQDGSAKFIREQAEDPNLRADVDAVWREAWRLLVGDPFPVQPGSPAAEVEELRQTIVDPTDVIHQAADALDRARRAQLREGRQNGGLDYLIGVIHAVEWLRGYADRYGLERRDA